MGVTDQGAREGRYAEAMLAGIREYMGLPDADVVWNFSLVKASGILADSIAPLVDAEVAAAVSEAQAEAQGWRKDSRKWRRATMSAETEVERLRDGIRALHTKGYASTSEEVWGQNPQCDECGVAWPCDTIALLDPSPAATTGEATPAECGAGHPTNPSAVPCVRDVGHEGSHMSTTGCGGSIMHWAPTPVSSGEAATGEADDEPCVCGTGFTCMARNHVEGGA